MLNVTSINIFHRLYKVGVVGKQTIIATAGNSTHFRAVHSAAAMAYKSVGKVWEDAGGVFGASTRWLKLMQKNWALYIICIMIMLLCIAFLYCVVQGYLMRKQVNIAAMSVVGAAKFVGRMGAVLPRQLFKAKSSPDAAITIT
jgi:hypothetical protein